MGVYIPNWKMPPTCSECPMSNDYRECNLTAESFGEMDCVELRADWCPLIELPPHGRLIDADVLQKLIKNESAFAEENIGEDEHSLKLGYLCAFGTASGIVRDAPTIIESEEEDG